MYSLDKALQVDVNDQLKKICGSSFCLRKKSFCSTHGLFKGQDVNFSSLKSLNSFVISQKGQYLQTDFSDIFSKKLAAIFPECSDINKHAINLEPGKQPPQKLIYRLGLIKLETLKASINRMSLKLLELQKLDEEIQIIKTTKELQDRYKKVDWVVYYQELLFDARNYSNQTYQLISQ